MKSFSNKYVKDVESLFNTDNKANINFSLFYQAHSYRDYCNLDKKQYMIRVIQELLDKNIGNNTYIFLETFLKLTENFLFDKKHLKRNFLIV